MQTFERLVYAMPTPGPCSLSAELVRRGVDHRNLSGRADLEFFVP